MFWAQESLPVRIVIGAGDGTGIREKDALIPVLFLTANMNFTSTKDIKAVCDSVGDTLTLVSGLISNVWGVGWGLQLNHLHIHL